MGKHWHNQGFVCVSLRNLAKLISVLPPCGEGAGLAMLKGAPPLIIIISYTVAPHAYAAQPHTHCFYCCPLRAEHPLRVSPALKWCKIHSAQPHTPCLGPHPLRSEHPLRVLPTLNWCKIHSAQPHTPFLRPHHLRAEHPLRVSLGLR